MRTRRPVGFFNALISAETKNKGDLIFNIGYWW